MAHRSPTTISAWRPPVPGIAEVFHAHFTDHAYPAHTHDTWDLMILDDGAVDFGLDRRRHGATDLSAVLLLPPGVRHDGRTVTAAGFRKRVLYLDTTVLPEHLIGKAVDAPILADPLLRHRIHRLHAALRHQDEVFEAESRLSFIADRLRFHLEAFRQRTPGREAHRLAVGLRDLLDARVRTGVSLREAAAVFHCDPTHLIRCFTRTYGLPPHAYLTGKRIELARGLLLSGQRPVDVATSVGFHDQAHLNRHFTRHVGITPARYATSEDLSPPRARGRASRPAR
ncbi:AraC family transcriptional regulator [Microbispora sp. NPDC088329]|uniref:helix-turn-helix domain-containing protein n=1 Tax=Microbispora sp. NPDC088329 TaxID=3154869 RepID=UPI00341D6359